MSETRSSRLAPLLALALLAALGGCVSGGVNPQAPASGSNTTTPDETISETPTIVPGPLEPPEKPADLTRENVVEFVNRSEYVRTYNRHRKGMTKITVKCEAHHTERTAAGFYVIAACGGSASNSEIVADFGPRPVPYFVTEIATVRVGDVETQSRSVNETYAAADSAENVNPPNQSAAGFRIYNFADRSRNVSVNVTYLNASRPERVLSTAYEVRPRLELVQNRVTVRRGAYRIDVRLGNGETATHRWTVDGSLGYSWKETAIYVTPTGEVFVVELPIHDLHT